MLRNLGLHIRTGFQNKAYICECNDGIKELGTEIYY